MSWDTARLATAAVATSVLLVSGSLKIVSRGFSIQNTLDEIGVWGGAKLGIAIGCYEVLLSCGLFIVPGPVISIGVFSLGLLIAGAGLRAVRLDRSIPCNCGLLVGTLGWKQVFMFPIWVAVAWNEIHLNVSKPIRTSMLTVVLCGVAIWKILENRKLIVRLREGRSVFEREV